MSKLNLPHMPDSPMFIDNIMTMEWQEFFRELFARVGGSGSIEDVLRLLFSMPEPKAYDGEIKRLEQLIHTLPIPKNYDSEIKGLKTIIASGALETSRTIAQINEYETLFIPAGAMTSSATNGATYLTYEYETNDINVNFLEFDGAAEEYAEFQFPMPEQWDLGTIKAKFFWSSATGSTAGDTVEWELQAGVFSDDDAIDAALGTSQVISDTLLANNGSDLQVSGATPAITVGGTPALGDMIHFKVSRNVGGTDDMAEDAWLFGVLLQYRIINKAIMSW